MTTTTRERPILFSSPMVQAILAGRKTMTRRVMKHQPPPCKGYPHAANGEWGIYLDRPHAGPYAHIGKCPYGAPGDRLWVRETFGIRPPSSGCELAPFGWKDPEQRGVIYRATWDRSVGGTRWRPSIHMPRWACRIVLEITEVRVERLQAITEEDAEAEGVFRHIAEESLDKVFRDERGATALRYFRELWDQINGKRPGCDWASNPFVWCVGFKRIDPAADRRDAT